MKKTKAQIFVNAICLTLVFSSVSFGSLQPVDYDHSAQEIKKTLEELVSANTTNPPGDEKKAVEVAVRKLSDAGISFEVSEFEPGRQNIVARLKGNGQQKPLLLLAHVDVVSAAGQAWSSKPHTLLDDGKYLQGRGVADDLGFAATALEVMLLIKKSGVVLNRDLILAWTGDEEMGGKGIKYLLKNKMDSVQAEFAINEGGGLRLSESGAVEFATVQVAEKSYMDFELVAPGTTGHSSVPVGDNAIYRISRALSKLGEYHFPNRLLPVTRAYFKERAKLEKGKIGQAMSAVANSIGEPPVWAVRVLEADPAVSAQLHTTCVATVLHSGNAPNALPADARANVNCRVLPGESVASVQKTLEQVIQDKSIHIRTERDFTTAKASTLESDAFQRINRIIKKRFPGIPIIPSMSTGATDSRHLRDAGITSYGLSPIALSEAEMQRYHGIDEKIRKKSIRDGVAFFHQLVLELSL